MKTLVELKGKCEDFLENNHHVYALKARRKKIALIGIEAANKHSTNLRITLGASKLITGGHSHEVAAPATIIGKLSEFTWDSCFTRSWISSRCWRWLMSRSC